MIDPVVTITVTEEDIHMGLDYPHKNPVARAAMRQWPALKEAWAAHHSVQLMVYGADSDVKVGVSLRITPEYLSFLSDCELDIAKPTTLTFEVGTIRKLGFWDELAKETAKANMVASMPAEPEPKPVKLGRPPRAELDLTFRPANE